MSPLALESAIFSKSPDSFDKNGMFKTNIWVLDRLNSTGCHHSLAVLVELECIYEYAQFGAHLQNTHTYTYLHT